MRRWWRARALPWCRARWWVSAAATIASGVLLIAAAGYVVYRVVWHWDDPPGAREWFGVAGFVLTTNVLMSFADAAMPEEE